MEKEHIRFCIYSSTSGEEIARIRVKFEAYKKMYKWSTTQLEGNILGKWLSLVRYDFDPKENISVHINKEYISIEYKEKFECHPQLLVETALKSLKSFSEEQILELIEKRKEVFLREGR